MTSAAEATLTAIRSMQGTLQVAAALLRSDRSIDLAGLELDAARICAAIGLLPIEEAGSLRPTLEMLLLEIDQVAAALAPPPPGAA